MAKGSILMVLLRLLSRSIGLVGTIVLARLLAPEEFGLVALAMVVVGGFEVAGHFGAGFALIRDQDAGRVEYDTAWTLQVVRGAIQGAALGLMAPFAAAFLGDARLHDIFLAFAVMFALVGFRNIGIVDFRKHLSFAPLIKLRAYSQLGAFAASIAVAVIWKSHWALIVGVLTERGLHAALSYVVHPYRPTFCLQAWRKLLQFTKWVGFNNVLAYLNGRTDVFVLSRFVGADVVGYYSVAKRVSNMTTSEITQPASQTLLPGFAKVAHDFDRLSTLYLSSLSAILFIGLPIAVGIFVLGDLIVQVVLGEKWLAAVPLLKVLAIYGIVRSSAGGAFSLMLVLGRPAAVTAVAVARFAVLVALLLWVLPAAGPIGVAWAVVTAATVGLFLNSAVIARVCGFSVMRVIAATWRTAVSAAVMAAVLFACHEQWPAAASSLGLLAQLAALVALGVAIYLLTCVALWGLSRFPDGTERQVVSLVDHGIARLSTALQGRRPAA